MLYAPTHLVDVLTGTTVDALGDATDAATIAAADVPVSLIERTRRVNRLDSQTPGTVRFVAFRAPYGTPVTQGDRFRDNSTGSTWSVDAVSSNTNPTMTPDMNGECRRIQ